MKASEPDANGCPRCGAALPLDAPGGVCPRCAFAGALESKAGDHDTQFLSLHDIPPPGQKVAYVGDYELLDVIARGGMGVVYKARQRSLNRVVALKMLLGGVHADETFHRRFRHEAELAAKLQHPNIVAIHEVGEHEGQPYFSMDFVVGENQMPAPTLADLVRGGPLEPRRAAELVKTVAEAVHHAHQRGVLHRDLKPSNILIGEGCRVVVTDFGLAKGTEAAEGLTLTGQALGTPGYLPPEQISSKYGKVGPPSDVYSLGAVLFCLLAGRPPFQGETVVEAIQKVVAEEPPALRQLNPAVPPELEALCLRCLEKDPLRRPATAAAVADELGTFLQGGLVLSKPSRRRPGKRSVVFRVAGAAVVAVLAALLWPFGSKPTHPAGNGATAGTPGVGKQPRPTVAGQLVQGYLAQEVYLGIRGYDVPKLVKDERFRKAPDMVSRNTSFEAAGFFGDNYGVRLYGFLHPPVSGSYVFYLSSDDNAELYLSPDTNTASISLVASSAMSRNRRSWPSASTTNAAAGTATGISKPVFLQAGNYYYVEALLKQANGPAFLGVAWQMPGEPPPKPGDPPISNLNLAYWDSGVPILCQPQSVTVKEGESARLSVIAGSPSFGFAQWEKDGQLIPGATLPFYTTPRLRRGDTSAKYRCVVMSDAAASAVRSEQAVVTVLPDREPPKLLSVAALPGTNLVFAQFSEWLDETSAVLRKNYQFSAGEITNAVLGPENRFVLLAVKALTNATFDLRVSGVKDFAGNAVLPGTRQTGRVSEFAALDIRPPNLTNDAYGLCLPCEVDGFDVLSAGGGWGMKKPDDFQFTFRRLTGDFDVSVLVTRFDPVAEYAQAGLMVRDSLDCDAELLHLSANPPEGNNWCNSQVVIKQNGSRAFQQLRPITREKAFGVNVPREWMRIRRAGAGFSSYRSQDGTNWITLLTVKIAWPEEVFVGMASSGGALADNARGYVSYRHLKIEQPTNGTSWPVSSAATSPPRTNSLGMVLVQVPETKVRFSIWETRVQDFESFVKSTGHQAPAVEGWTAAGISPPGAASWRTPGFKQGPTHPVCAVGQADARAFCQWLTDQERKAGQLGTNELYRLPTAEEWRTAAGYATYTWGDNWPPPSESGNYAGEEARDWNWPTNRAVISGFSDGFPRTAPVGSFAPSQYGLFDLGGNVWEWCEDKIDVALGGSWYDISSGNARISSDWHFGYGHPRTHVGFRCVLAPTQETSGRTATQ